MKIVKAKWALKHAKEINIIDVRSPDEFNSSHIEGAKNIPLPGIMMNAEHLLDKSKEYYLICHSGARSMRAYSHLEVEGFDVVQIEGGNSAIGLS